MSWTKDELEEAADLAESKFGICLDAALFAAYRLGQADGTASERERCARIVSPTAEGDAAPSIMWNERYRLAAAIRAKPKEGA